MWILALIGPVVLEKTFEAFSLYESMKTSDPWGGAIFYLRAIIWTILVEVHKISYIPNIKRPWPSSFRKEDFESSAYRSLHRKIWPFRKKGQSQPKVIIFQTLLGAYPQCCIPSPKALALWFWRRFFKGFYHIWAWWPSWSCDPDVANKLLFPQPMKVQYEIWLCLTQRFLRRRDLKSVDDGWMIDRRMDGRVRLNYKLTYEPKGSGELIIKTNRSVQKLTQSLCLYCL